MFAFNREVRRLSCSHDVQGSSASWCNSAKQDSVWRQMPQTKNSQDLISISLVSTAPVAWNVGTSSLVQLRALWWEVLGKSFGPRYESAPTVPVRESPLLAPKLTQPQSFLLLWAELLRVHLDIVMNLSVILRRMSCVCAAPTCGCIGPWMTNQMRATACRGLQSQNLCDSHEVSFCQCTFVFSLFDHGSAQEKATLGKSTSGNKQVKAKTK